MSLFTPSGPGAAVMEGTARTGPLDVCMVISSYHPIVGGAEKQVAQIARIMADDGHRVHIVTRRYPGLSARERIDGVEVSRIAMSGPLGRLSFVIGAAREIRRLRPDVIHCHSLFSPALAGAIGRQRAGQPLLAKPMCGGEASRIASKAFGRKRLAYLGRSVDRFIVVSREIEDELLDLGLSEEKLRYIPNGVDAQRFSPLHHAANREELRLRLGLPAGVLFLFAGRMAAQKRLPLLLEAWRSVRADLPQATLLIAGANRASQDGFEATFGEGEEIPPALLDQPGVRLLGHVDDMPTLLRACDVFVLPSAREGLSNALLEACATGLATITARTGGAMDLMSDGQNGLMFAVDDRSELADALHALAVDEDLRIRLGAAARRTVCEKFDIRQTAAGLLAQYADLVEHEGRRERDD
jgi:glycosyltransferase involved in cell wall biosynthesis